MAQQSMRGMRLGSESFESSKGVNLSPRNKYNYRCAKDHLTEIVFSDEAEVPNSWACKACSLEAALLDAEGNQAFATEIPKAPRTHFEMLLERRSREELEEILTERLDELKARRKRGQADATNN
ncbi:MAG: hypothetical protein EBS85_01125 [Micrococcales bacterium]|nr:hypothetical protein [Actinomycetota bacterium]NCA07320.1 hypothetical protein [Micrococcales bacterium]